MNQSLKNITQPDKNGFQVRIVRKGTEKSRYFSYKLWGSKKKALKAAQNYRDQMMLVLPKKRMIEHAKNNRSTGVLGVCQTQRHYKKRGLTYLVYAVSWIDYKGKKHTQAFPFGRIEEFSVNLAALAFKTAIKFRKDWEKHVDNNSLHLFDYKKYGNWRNTN